MYNKLSNIESLNQTSNKNLIKPIVLERYAKMPYWTIEEALRLQNGYHPAIERKNEARLKTFDDDILKKNLLIRCIECGEIIAKNGKIKPLHFINWCKLKDLPCPKELEKLVREHHRSEDEDIDLKAKIQTLENKYNSVKRELEKAIQVKNELQVTNIKLSKVANKKILHATTKKTLIEMIGTLTAIAYDTESFINETIKVNEVFEDFQVRGVGTDIKSIRKYIDESYVALKNVIYKEEE